MRLGFLAAAAGALVALSIATPATVAAQGRSISTTKNTKVTKYR